MSMNSSSQYPSLWIDSSRADNELRELRDAIRTINTSSPVNIHRLNESIPPATNSKAVLSALKALQNRIQYLTEENQRLEHEHRIQLTEQRRVYDERVHNITNELNDVRSSAVADATLTINKLEKRCIEMEKIIEKERSLREHVENRYHHHETILIQNKAKCQKLITERDMLTDRLNEMHKTLNQELSYSSARIAELEGQCMELDRLNEDRIFTIGLVEQALEYTHSEPRRIKTKLVHILEQMLHRLKRKKMIQKKKKKKKRGKSAKVNRKYNNNNNNNNNNNYNNDFPFVVPTSTTPSFSVPLKVQQIMAEERAKSPIKNNYFSPSKHREYNHSVKYEDDKSPRRVETYSVRYDDDHHNHTRKSYVDVDYLGLPKSPRRTEETYSVIRYDD